ncbi:MAG: nuclear transport factor 2 family protein [Gammaproteobacteria bacterium]|nr:nuclear transport factor 2 family protein [Gammaproteobacteria bacterium]
MDTKSLIEKYYQAWIDSDRQQARSLMADDLKFRSPNDDFDSADAFLEGCWRHAAGFNEMNVAHAVYDEQGGYIVYSGEGFSCGELVKVKDGKINEIYVTFNPTQ